MVRDVTCFWRILYMYLCTCNARTHAPQLRLQGRLQERQALVQKKGELTAQNETMGRQVKVRLA